MSLCRRQALLRLNPRKRIAFSATNSFVYLFFLKAGSFQQIILMAWHNSSSKFSLLWINLRICVYPLWQIPYQHWPPRQQFYQKWKVFPRRGFGSTSWPLARVSSNTTKCFWLRTEQRKRSVLDVRLKRRFALIMVELRASIELWICLCLQIFLSLFCGVTQKFHRSICLINDFLHFLKWGYESCGSRLIVPELLFASGNEFWSTAITQ